MERITGMCAIQCRASFTGSALENLAETISSAECPQADFVHTRMLSGQTRKHRVHQGVPENVLLPNEAASTSR